MSRGGDRDGDRSGDRVIGVKRLLGLQQGKRQMKKFTHNGRAHRHFHLPSTQSPLAESLEKGIMAHSHYRWHI